MIKLSNEFITLKLIEAVKRHECIWNTKLFEHSKRDIVENAWKQIGEELGKSAITCREKWKNVKTGFFRNIGEYTSSSRPKSARKKFYLYNEMEFLLPFVKKAKNRKAEKSQIVAFENEEEIQYYSIDTLDTTNSPLTIEDSNDNDYNRSNSMPSLMTIDDPFKSITSENIKIENQPSKLNEMINVNDNIKAVTHNFEADNNSSSDVSEKEEKPKLNIKSKSRKRSHSKHNFKLDELESEILKYIKRKRKSKQRITNVKCSLMKFFKSNIPDILSLSRKNQRLFKMKMLDIIEELHNDEKTPSTGDNASK